MVILLSYFLFNTEATKKVRMTRGHFTFLPFYFTLLFYLSSYLHTFYFILLSYLPFYLLTFYFTLLSSFLSFYLLLYLTFSSSFLLSDLLPYLTFLPSSHLRLGVKITFPSQLPSVYSLDEREKDKTAESNVNIHLDTTDFRDHVKGTSLSIQC